MQSFKEGTLESYLQETFIEDEYLLNMILNYQKKTKFKLDAEFLPPYTGSFSMTLTHTGTYECPADAVEGASVDCVNDLNEEVSKVPVIEIKVE
jgi:hypothetical protein